MALKNKEIILEFIKKTTKHGCNLSLVDLQDEMSQIPIDEFKTLLLELFHSKQIGAYRWYRCPECGGLIDIVEKELEKEPQRCMACNNLVSLCEENEMIYFFILKKKRVENNKKN